MTQNGVLSFFAEWWLFIHAWRAKVGPIVWWSVSLTDQSFLMTSNFEICEIDFNWREGDYGTFFFSSLTFKWKRINLFRIRRRYQFMEWFTLWFWKRAHYKLFDFNPVWDTFPDDMTMTAFCSKQKLKRHQITYLRITFAFTLRKWKMYPSRIEINIQKDVLKEKKSWKQPSPQSNERKMKIKLNN